MTKTVSLADDAYKVLATVKRPEEIFSDLARRLAHLAAQEQLFRPSGDAGVWTDQEAEALRGVVYRARDESSQSGKWSP